MSSIDRLSGVLLGVALGDALGLPCEGMSSRSIARRFGKIDRFRMLGAVGFVSDDTEQAALIAQSLARHPDDLGACVDAFQRSLLGWFCRLPWGVGRATIRASLRIALGLKPSGVWSAGNGAAMRAGVVGVFFQDRPEPRRAFGRALAETTHRDPRAIEGALYVAEIAACCAVEPAEASRRDIAVRSQAVVADRELATAIDRAISLADAADSTQDAAKVCGTSGYVVSTVAFATFCFLKYGDDPIEALSQAIAAGGDTDSIAAILGGWLGALHGERGLPPSLLGRIHDGPFGPTHLRALARCLEARLTGTLEAVPRYSAAAALVRNLLLYPVVIAHGFRRLLPF